GKESGAAGFSSAARASANNANESAAREKRIGQFNAEARTLKRPAFAMLPAIAAVGGDGDGNRKTAMLTERGYILEKIQVTLPSAHPPQDAGRCFAPDAA